MKREGSTLVLASGLRVRPDRRTLRGPSLRAFAHVCAAPTAADALPYDDPSVQGARRAALGWWVPLLAGDFVCLTTLALDSVRCAGAITVALDPARFGDDPFARLFPGEVVETDLFCAVPPPAGPVIERYAGAAWPGGSF